MSLDCSITELEIQHGVFEPWKRKQKVVEVPVDAMDLPIAPGKKRDVVPYNPYNYQRPSKNHAFAAYTGSEVVLDEGY